MRISVIKIKINELEKLNRYQHKEYIRNNMCNSCDQLEDQLEI